jgi:peptide deformylase
VDITRHSHVLVKGIDLKGKEIELEADGLIARVIQHEIDHLNGRVILNYASSLKRSIYLKKAQKSKV